MILDAEQIDMWDYWDETQPDQEDPRLKTPTEMLKEYHKTAGLPFNVDYTDVDNLDLLRLRGDLILEEAVEAEAELQDGEWGENNQVKVLKELADVIYVVYGTAVTFGWDLDEAIRRVHDNNMGRMYQDDGSIKRREDGKIIKNPNYPAVDLGDLV